MVLSQLQLAYLYYLELSLSFTKLQNYSVCESLIYSMTFQKVKKQQQQNR